MKPRFKKIDGLWYCGVLGELKAFVGIGWTVSDAWREWVLKSHD